MELRRRRWAGDLATLFSAYRSDNPQRTNVGVAIGMVIGITMLDIVTGQMTTTVHAREPNEWRRYNDRSGFPGGVQQARGQPGERVGRDLHDKLGDRVAAAAEKTRIASACRRTRATAAEHHPARSGPSGA